MTRILLALLVVAATLSPSHGDLSDFLPLNVGNSWTYGHLYSDKYSDRDNRVRGYQTVTLRIRRTEVIAGKTYYVFGDFSPSPHPAPPHSLFGKKVRWEGDSLMVHDGTYEYPFLRFTETPAQGQMAEETYSVDPAEAEGAKKVTRVDFSELSGGHTTLFEFLGSPREDATNLRHFQYSRSAIFIRGYGLMYVIERVDNEDYSLFENILSGETARLLESSSPDGGGETSARDADSEDTYREISRDDASANRGLMRHDHTTTGSTSKSSWGQTKETYR